MLPLAISTSELNFRQAQHSIDRSVQFPRRTDRSSIRLPRTETLRVAVLTDKLIPAREVTFKLLVIVRGPKLHWNEARSLT